MSSRAAAMSPEGLAGLRAVGLFLVICGFALGAAWRYELFLPEHVVAMRRNLRNHGLLDAQPLVERIGRRVPFLEDVARRTNLRRLLLVGGHRESVGRWFLGSLTLALLVTLALVLLDFVAVVSGGSAPLPIWMALAGGGALLVLRYFGLSRDAARRRELMGSEVGDSLAALGVLVTGAGLSVDEALARLTKYTREQAVYPVLHDQQWRQLTNVDARSIWQIFGAIGREYEVGVFRDLAQVSQTFMQSGADRRALLTQLATREYERRLFETRLQVGRAQRLGKILMVPMLLPLLILILYPIVVTGGQSLAGG